MMDTGLRRCDDDSLGHDETIHVLITKQRLLMTTDLYTHDECSLVSKNL